MNQQASNKAKDFARYKEKWGLADYRFGISHRHEIIVVPKNWPDGNIWLYNEIKTTHSLIKRRNDDFLLYENLSAGPHKFNGLQDLLEYLLIKKIAL